MSYEVGTSIGLRALHTMPVEGPEGVLHAHDYRIDVVVERAELDDNGMVCDLDVLTAALRELAARLEGQDLDAELRPDWAEAVTVEVFARVVHAVLAERVRDSGAEMLGVRVWESADSFGGYRAPITPPPP